MCPNDSIDGSGRKCFGGMEIASDVDDRDLATADFFKYDISTNTGSSTGNSKPYWTDQARASVIDNFVLGIPLGITCDSATNNVCGGQVSEPTNMINWGGSRQDNVSGKVQTGRTGRTDADMGLYWAIQDNKKAWWELDHIVIQSIYQNGAGDDFLARINNSQEYSGDQQTALL